MARTDIPINVVFDSPKLLAELKRARTKLGALKTFPLGRRRIRKNALLEFIDGLIEIIETPTQINVDISGEQN